MEAMCGAIGEVAQICVMYPLETIKVRRSCSRSIMSFVLRALRKPAAACLTRPALLHSGLHNPGAQGSDESDSSEHKHPLSGQTASTCLFASPQL